MIYEPVCYCEPGIKRLAGTPSRTAWIKCAANCPSGTTEDESGVCVPNCAVKNYIKQATDSGMQWITYNENVEFSYIPGGQPTYSGSRTYYACSCKEGYSNSAGTGEVVTESETIQCI
jgi:hypothetical protein